jgi:hypothetical protein
MWAPTVCLDHLLHNAGAALLAVAAAASAQQSFKTPEVAADVLVAAARGNKDAMLTQARSASSSLGRPPRATASAASARRSMAITTRPSPDRVVPPQAGLSITS